MPNHVTNIISFKGSAERIAELKNTIRGKEEQVIDFEKIIPRPESLNITAGSKVDYGIAVLLFREKGDSSKLNVISGYPWAKAENLNTLEKLANHLVENNMADLNEGRIALANLEKYGHKDWYSWSIENWGTKWNAYSIDEIDDCSIKFETAWSTPFNVIEKLSAMFDDIEITLLFADEDFGHNCGEVVLLAGKTIKENIPEGGTLEALILASKVQGSPLYELMYHAGNDDEEFICSLLNVMIDLFSAEEVVDELDTMDLEFISSTFLEKLKEELINRECYELIGRVDKCIKELAEK